MYRLEFKLFFIQRQLTSSQAVFERADMSYSSMNHYFELKTWNFQWVSWSTKCNDLFMIQTDPVLKFNSLTQQSTANNSSLWWKKGSSDFSNVLCTKKKGFFNLLASTSHFGILVLKEDPLGFTIHPPVDNVILSGEVEERPPHMIVKRFGCTTIHKKRYINASFIIHSSYYSW